MGFEFLIGGVLRFLPEITKFFTVKKEFEHEQKMLELNIKADELRGKIAQQAQETKGQFEQAHDEIEAISSAVKEQLSMFTRTGNAVVDAFGGVADLMSKFVRPLLTYWYCIGAYGAYKTALYMQLVSSSITWDVAVIQLWTANDQAVMLSILGFWFTDRALRSLGR